MLDIYSISFISISSIVLFFILRFLVEVYFIKKVSNILGSSLIKSYLEKQFNVYNVLLLIIWTLAIAVFVYLIVIYINKPSDKLPISAIAVLLSAFMASFAVMKTINFTANLNKITTYKDKYVKYEYLEFLLNKCKIYLPLYITEDVFLLHKAHSRYAKIFEDMSTKLSHQDFLVYNQNNISSYLLKIAGGLDALAMLLNVYHDLEDEIILNPKIYKNYEVNIRKKELRKRIVAHVSSLYSDSEELVEILRAEKSTIESSIAFH